MLIRHLLAVALALTACDSKKTSGGAKEERPAPFELKVNKVEKLDMVAPNQTWIDQGLGKKAPEGKVFVCVQFTVTNTSDKPETTHGAHLVDGKGATIEVSTTAAGKYQPEDWKTDDGVAQLEPKKALKKADCFEVATDATTGMTLGIVDTGWGKSKPWHTSVPL